MHVVIAGASGFLGTRLAEHLRAGGHDVTALVRRAAGEGESTWDPYAGQVDGDLVASADVVANLAGAPVVGNPHSKRWRRRLRDSRITTTRVLAEAIAAVDGDRPAYLAQSGINYYGDHGQEEVTEQTDSRGDALMTALPRDWEAATAAASEAGARVCRLRTAPVMDRGSPPLSQLLLPFRLGLGARLGDGRHYAPCVSLRDWLGGVTHLAEHPEAAGPFNLCCPMTPTNDEFTDALAQALGRRARLAAPRFAINTAAGPLGPMLLDSINARPAALVASGYEFRDADVRDALAAALAA